MLIVGNVGKYLIIKMSEGNQDDNAIVLSNNEKIKLINSLLK